MTFSEPMNNALKNTLVVAAILLATSGVFVAGTEFGYFYSTYVLNKELQHRSRVYSTLAATQGKTAQGFYFAGAADAYESLEQNIRR